MSNAFYKVTVSVRTQYWEYSS